MNQYKLLRITRIANEIARTYPKKYFNFLHVSVITTKKGCVLGIGVNQTKTHPLNIRMGYRTDRIHSELAAYQSIRWKLNTRFVLFNFRFGKNYDLRLAKPCIHCYNWLRLIDNLSDIYYTNELGNLVKLVEYDKYT